MDTALVTRARAGDRSAIDVQRRMALAPDELGGSIVLVAVAPLDGEQLMSDRRLESPGHTVAPNALAFSPDGQLLASTSGDGSTRIWRVDDGTQLRVFVSTIERTPRPRSTSGR